MRYSRHSRGSKSTKPFNPSARDVTPSSKNQQVTLLTTCLRPRSTLRPTVTASPEVSPPPARINSRSPPTRVYLTRYVPSSGFFTLLTVYSFSSLPALFHAGALMGFSPFKAFPSHRAGTSLDALYPHAVSSRIRHRTRPAVRWIHDRSHTPAEAKGLVSAQARSPDFRVLFPMRVRCDRPECLALVATRCSLEFSNSLQGLPPPASNTDSHRCPPSPFGFRPFANPRRRWR
jgi:hypothetical protein